MLQWLHLAVDALLLVGYAAMTVLMYGFIRRRHDESLSLFFKLYALSLVARGGHHLFVVLIWLTFVLKGVTDAWWAIPLLVVKTVAATTWLTLVVYLLKITPKVMLVPNTQKMGELISTLRAEVRKQELRINALAAYDPVLAEQHLSQTIHVLKTTTPVPRKTES